MKIFSIKNEPFDSHMYIVSKDGQNCVIIDLGGDFSLAKEVLKRENLTPKAVILTHCHFDHVNGVKSARDKGIDVYISPIDGKLIESSEGTLASFVGTQYTPINDYKTLLEGKINIANMDIEVINTPGHTLGSISLLIDDCLFTGDTLFYHTVGRTDLPGGNIKDLEKSINRLIAPLFSGNNYKVYPGHGKTTDLQEEYNNNPFLTK